MALLDSTLVAALLGLALIAGMLWLGLRLSRETPAQQANREADFREWRQERRVLRQADRQAHAEREARVRELAEAVRRGVHGW